MKKRTKTRFTTVAAKAYRARPNADARTPSATRRAKIDFSGSKDTSKQTRSVYDGQSLGLTRRRSVTFRQRSKGCAPIASAPAARSGHAPPWTPRAPQQVRPSLRAAGPVRPLQAGLRRDTPPPLPVPARRGGHAPLPGRWRTFKQAAVAHCKSCACAMQQEAAAAAPPLAAQPQAYAPPVVPAPPPPGRAAQAQPQP